MVAGTKHTVKVLFGQFRILLLGSSLRVSDLSALGCGLEFLIVPSVILMSRYGREPVPAFLRLVGQVLNFWNR